MLEQWQLILVSCLISFIIRLTAEYRGLLSLTHSLLSLLFVFLPCGSHGKYLEQCPISIYLLAYSDMPYMKCKQRPNRSTLSSCSTVSDSSHFHCALSIYSTYCALWVCNGDSRIQLFCGLSNCWHDSVSDMVRGCPGHMCTSLDGWDRLAGYGLTFTVSHRCTIGQSQSQISNIYTVHIYWS